MGFDRSPPRTVSLASNAVDAEANGNHEKARGLYLDLPSEEPLSTDALFSLSGFYRFGLGVTRD